MRMCKYKTLFSTVAGTKEVPPKKVDIIMR